MPCGHSVSGNRTLACCVCAHADKTCELRNFYKLCNKNAAGKIVLSNIPTHVRIEDLEPLLTPFGQVQNCEKLNSRDGSTHAVQVSYETQEQAQQ
ncbi:unnamed protein product [Timema podura]|uniref:RRM domain-containing protein n=1 Tax=Timema podura TaxID=61482 RepID=A0ABN7PK14_TIMPD|nr:unnamed protein product [Timema podura]